MSIVPIKSLFETHLTVRDLDASIAFYSGVVGLEVAHRVAERHAAFLWIGRPGQAMLGLWSHHTSPLWMRLHLAFAVDAAHVIASVDRLRKAGVTPRDGSGLVTDEPDVIAWMPALSVYFDDPDGHSLEFISMLDEPPRPGLGFVPLSRWRATASGSE